MSRGIIGTLNLCLVNIFQLIKVISPAYRKKEADKRAQDFAFDDKFGLDTTGFVNLGKLSIKSENWIYGVRYQPVNISMFLQALNGIRINHTEFEFIDLGSGKGRALLLAANKPFKKIVGVEFSEELNIIARRNIKCYPDELKKCKEIDIICMDASVYNFPNNPFVLFLYNPFSETVMNQVVGNIKKTYMEYARRIIIIYYTPKHRELWERAPFLKTTETNKSYIVFDTLNQ